MDISGRLYVVATPIGNMQDITARALETLRDSDLIVCEDTRVTGGLLHKQGIKKQMRALNEFNEEAVLYEIISQLKDGAVVSLVSDSGTPLISDPGFLLVRQARKSGITVIPIPGASAVIAALSASGLPSDSFLFSGFLPKQQSKKQRFFQHFKDTITKDYSPTLIFYESPHRIVHTLQIMLKIFEDREVTIARELTKIHEEFYTDSISALLSAYTQKVPKGELTVLFSLKS